MANFQPLNKYSLLLLDKLVKKYKLKDPFLDIACGNGYVSKHLAKRGWSGKAIDYSPKAVSVTQENLKGYKEVKVEKISLSNTYGKYNTILMFDILEHLDDDISALQKAYSLLEDSGFLVIAGPSNHNEWRWDDDFYGHVRRYSEEDLKNKLKRAGLVHIISYDYTYPFFWILRRLYTKLINKTSERTLDKEKQTKKSSFINAWDIPLVANYLNKIEFIWFPIYLIQYAFFKNLISKGCSMIVLAKKK